MKRTRAWQLDRLLHEVPATVDDARPDPRGPGSDQVLHAERRKEFLGPFRHDALREGGRPFLRRQGDEVGVHEEPQFVPQREPEESRCEVLGIIEETAIGVRPGDRDRIRPDLSPPVRADDPVRIEERELRVPRDRVDVAAAQVMPLGADLPVFSAEVKVRVFEADPERVRDVDRVAAGRVDQEPGLHRFVPAADVHANLPSGVDKHPFRRGLTSEPDLEVVSRHID